MEGRGYGVIESLPSLGKGRTCSGIFITEERHRDALEALWQRRTRVPFSGRVHYRQHSADTMLEVVVSRVDPPCAGEVTAEFTALDISPDLVG